MFGHLLCFIAIPCFGYVSEVYLKDISDLHDVISYLEMVSITDDSWFWYGFMCIPLGFEMLFTCGFNSFKIYGCLFGKFWCSGLQANGAELTNHIFDHEL